MTLLRVISGGQNGVDLAALRAARAVGLATGGWMPRHWQTLDGPRPQYRAEFGMRECPVFGYPARTHRNVQEADATLRLAIDFDSAGERCTRDAIVKHRKPSLDVPFLDLLPTLAADAVVAWIRHHGIATLNVAGNSERTAPGIGAVAETFLREVFRAARVAPSATEF